MVAEPRRSAARQLNVRLTQRQHEALRRYAARRRTPVTWLIKDYVDAIVAREEEEAVRSHEPTQVASRGGSLDWLSEEPELYTEADGEPIRRAARRARR